MRSGGGDDTLRANVLAVDDSRSARSYLSEVLHRGGHEVFVARSGEEALDLLDQIHIDLVVADLILPAMDGYELCRRVKDLNPRFPIPVLLLTAKGDLDAKLAGFAAGADDYILKPFRPEELIARVRAQLRLKGLQEELRDNAKQLSLAQGELEARLRELQTAYQAIQVHTQRTERDLGLASKVQRAILPPAAPPLQGMTAACAYQPAQIVAGDFFDFLPLDDGRWGVAVGDVAGKGAGASLLMVMAVTALRQASRDAEGPAAALRAVNTLILDQYGAGDVISLFYGELDPARRRLRYSTAGHEPALLLGLGEDEPRQLREGGPFLGVFPDLALDEGEVALAPGDRLLLLTDGVLERYAPRNELVAHERLRADLLARRQQPPGEWLAGLPAGDERHPEPDDVTAVLLEVER